MTMAQTWKYKAFVSYSGEDEKFSREFSRTLERYRVPRRLIGTLGRNGVIAKQVGSIYCDPGSDDDLALLVPERLRALNASQYLIVVCSPDSAQSPRVNEEIRIFKTLRGENHVLCVIVAGEPNASVKSDSNVEECFPKAIRYLVSSDGKLTDEMTEPIAADARTGKDGFRNSRLKVLSGLLGVEYDSLRQRDLRRRRMRLMQLTTVGCVALIIGLYSYLTLQNKKMDLLRVKSESLVAASIQETLSGNATNGLLLALKALPADGQKQPWSAGAEQALYQAVLEHREILHLGPSIFGNIDAVALSPDGKVIAVVVGKTAVLWNSSTGERISLLEAHEEQINAIAFSPDSLRVLTVSDDMTARLWSVPDGKELLVFKEHIHHVTYGAFSPDGSLVATASEDNTARIWETSTGALKHKLTGHQGKVTSVSFNSDGSLLTTTSWDKTVKYWDVQTGEYLGGTGHERGYVSDSFNAEINVTNDYLLAFVGGKSALLMNADSDVTELGRGNESPEIKGSVSGAVFSPNGQLIAASFIGFNDVWIWDTATKTLQTKLLGHEYPIRSISFSPDNRMIVTTSGDRTARIWNVGTGLELLRLGHNQSVAQAFWSKEGDRVLTRSGNFDCTLWDVRLNRSKLKLQQSMTGGISHLRKTANKLATRKLTLQQLKKFNLDCVDFIWPVTGRVVDGYRSDPDLDDNGIGIESIEGSPVVAVADGEVFETGENGWIIIQHNKELFSAYKTDTPELLEKKQKVKKGQKIAVVGKLSNQMMGIFFSLIEDKIILDPLEFLPPKNGQ